MAHAKESKVTATGGRRIIERPRLLTLLDETTARTILLIAPAGYGKTTLAQQWARGRKGCVWYTASGPSRDVAVLAREIAEAVASEAGASARFFEEFLQASNNPARQASRISSTLADSIESSGVQEIVIDDYQSLIGATHAESTIEAIRARTSLRLIVTSRVRPTWATPRTLLYGDITEISRQDLLMTQEESDALLDGTAQSGRQVLTRRAAGWPALLGLAVLARDAAPPADAVSQTLYDFFAEEVLRSTKAEVQDDLMTMALLPNLAPRALAGAFGGRTDEIVKTATELGLLASVNKRYDLHPLLRDFLITKLQSQPDAESRVRGAVNAAIESCAWDTAIELVRRFEFFDLIEPVITAAYRPLLKNGRIGTLVDLASYGQSAIDVFVPACDLVQADVALREGAYDRAEEIALRVARLLGDRSLLTSHAYSVAGHAAYSSWHASRASGHFEHARACASTDNDLGDAIWGIALAAIYGESGDLRDAVEALQTRRDLSPTDLVRWSIARNALARAGESLGVITDFEETLEVARRLRDPRIRTSFMATYSYYRCLQSDYGPALAVARETLHDAQTFDLAFVIPHAQWNIAFASLGMRRFADAEKALQVVEEHAHNTGDAYHVLNSRCLRARFLLMLGKFSEAEEQVRENNVEPATQAMWKEYVATRALALAAMGDEGPALSAADEASAPGSPVEARALAAMARAILGVASGAHQEVRAAIDVCMQLDTWDPFVCGVRVEPKILNVATEDTSMRSQFERVLSNSCDSALGRRAGLVVRMSPAKGATLLSPREREVFELLKKGLTNREIARALFISEATAKVHVRHLMEKLKARTRTEAASRIVS
jgi:LuxR family transcriptional regulator, maltose regulon positive regulatory protein